MQNVAILLYQTKKKKTVFFLKEWNEGKQEMSDITLFKNLKKRTEETKEVGLI